MLTQQFVIVTDGQSYRKLNPSCVRGNRYKPICLWMWSDYMLYEIFDRATETFIPQCVIETCFLIARSAFLKAHICSTTELQKWLDI